MNQDPKNRALSDDDAWLEQALLQAASELSVFRASAQAERERLLHAQDSVRTRVVALEEQLRQSEARHAAELEDARAALESQQNDRAKAWGEFSQGLKQRIAALGVARQQHARDVEEAGALRAQLHQAHLQLEALQGTNAELETRLAASEESYAVAGDAMRVAREEAAEMVSQREKLRVELTASAGSCAELQGVRQAQARKIEELEAARIESERRATLTRDELTLARERIAVLEQQEREAQRLRGEIEDVARSNQAQADELARTREQAANAARAADVEKQNAERARDAEKQAAEQARTEAAAALQRAREAHDDVLAARRERDETTRALEARFSAELATAQSERDQARRELEEQSSTRWAMLDIEKQRSAKLKTELEAKSAELEPLRADRERIVVQLRQISAERDRVAAELQQLSSERANLEHELQLLRNAQPGALPRARVNAPDPRDQQTIPILPDMAPANAPSSPSRPPPPRREGTAYSYSEVAEEQVFVPARPPAKGGSGGRGPR